jgi:SlyX protein
MAMEEQRFIEIETKLAHQEDLLDELNAVVTDQQSQISRLEELCRTLVSRLRSLGEGVSAASPEDERPPHY